MAARTPNIQSVIHMNRRSFLRTSALAAAPLILPSRIRGAGAPSRALNLGIVGAGTRCNTHIGQFSRIPGLRVVAVCDIWPERAEKAKGAVDALNRDTHCKAYHDFRELIANPEIDIVTVAVPDHWHALVAVEAANRGKHIYLEKPFAHSIKEGQAIVKAVKRNGVILQNGTQQRSLASFQRAVYLARHGYLGNIERAYAISPPGPAGGDPTQTEIPPGFDYEFFTGPAPKTPFYRELMLRPGTPGWYFTSVFGGGWVTAWGSHHVDSAQFALGKDYEAPIAVEAEGQYPETGVFDTVYSWRAEFTYTDGKKMVYCTSDRPDSPKTGGNIVVVGDRGWVAASRGKVWSNPASLVERVWPRSDPDLKLMDGGGDGDHFTNFIDAIRTASRLNAPMEVGRLSTTLCHLTNIGIEVQRPLRWDTTAESFVNDPGANRLLGRPLRAPWKLS